MFLFWTCLTCMCLLIWFKSEAFVYYSELFFSRKSLMLDEYFKLKEVCQLSYPNFLLLEHPNFLTKLLSCVLCLNFWLEIPVLFYDPFLFPVAYICSLFL